MISISVQIPEWVVWTVAGMFVVSAVLQIVNMHLKNKLAKMEAARLTDREAGR